MAVDAQWCLFILLKKALFKDTRLVDGRLGLEPSLALPSLVLSNWAVLLSLQHKL